MSFEKWSEIFVSGTGNARTESAFLGVFFDLTGLQDPCIVLSVLSDLAVLYVLLAL